MSENIHPPDVSLYSQALSHGVDKICLKDVKFQCLKLVENLNVTKTLIEYEPLESGLVIASDMRSGEGGEAWPHLL